MSNEAKIHHEIALRIRNADGDTLCMLFVATLFFTIVLAAGAAATATQILTILYPPPLAPDWKVKAVEAIRECKAEDGRAEK